MTVVPFPVQDHDELEPLLTAQDVAKLLNVRLKRVYELSVRELAIVLGPGTLRWRRREVLQWLEQRRPGKR